MSATDIPDELFDPLFGAMLGASSPSQSFLNMCFRIALPSGANGLRFGCDHLGCLDQHAFSGAQVRFDPCVQQQVAKVVLADDARVLCFPRVRKTIQQPRPYPIRSIFLANRNP